MLQQLTENNGVIDSNKFWNLYNKDKQTVIEAFNKEAFVRFNILSQRIDLLKQFVKLRT